MHSGARAKIPAFVGAEESEKIVQQRRIMERKYKRIEVIGRGEKNSPTGTKQAVRSGAPHRSVVRGSAQDLLRSEQRSQQTERLALLGTMAAVFAHEAGNPLAGILLSLKCVESQLEKQEVDDPFLISTIRGAIEEVGRLGSLLKEFRSLVPEHTLDLKCTNLVKIAEEALALEMITYRAAGITVKFAFEDALPLVRLDTAKIKQVILNLCRNAAEAMPNGGCLTLKGYRARGMVVLEVSDDGVGVPDDVNIFELFQTTKPGGTGLGLPLVQQIVSAHDGTIAYKSKPGRGATFKVSLPLSEKNPVVGSTTTLTRGQMPAFS
jgi:signal transduction histidine kinase